MKKLETTVMIVWVVVMCTVCLIASYKLGEKAEKATVPVIEETVQHTRVIEQCTRVNLLSCIACHDFPAYVIDVQPEIWED